MTSQSIKFPNDLIEAIDLEIKKIGYGLKRAAWIKQACKEKLETDRKNLEQVISKLRKWNNSFPKRQFKEILEELENGQI